MTPRAPQAKSRLRSEDTSEVAENAADGFTLACPVSFTRDIVFVFSSYRPCSSAELMNVRPGL